MGALTAYLKGARSGVAPTPAAAKQNDPAENPVFKANCASCHGKDKKGNAGMAKLFKVEPVVLDLTDKDVQAKSAEKLSKIISDGKDKMPAYKSKLNEGQIKELVGFIKPVVVKSEPEAAGVSKSSAAEVQAMPAAR